MAEPDAPELFDRERAQELHEKLLADLAERVNELETLLGRHDAFSVLSQLALLEFWHDPETFKEYEHAGLSAHVEYVAQLLLKSPYAHGSDAELLVGNSVERIRDLVTDIFRMSFWLRLREAELSGNNLDPADHLRHRTITQEMHFRSPGYLCHLRPVLLGLFEPFDAWLLQHLGFTAEDAVTVADGITHMLNRRVMERTHEAVEFSEKLLADLDRHRRGETCTDDDGYRAVVERFVGLEDEAAVAHSRMIASSWFMFGLSAAMEFDARLVSEETGIAEHRVAACLDYFAQGFGSERPEFYRPEPLHRLRVRPLLKHGGTYLSPCNGLFMWAIQPRLEEALKPRWEAYQRARARFLEQESVRVLSAALGDAVAHRSLHYFFDDGTGGSDFDVDGLVQYDTVLFIVEGKAGTLSESARRGSKDRIRVKLQELVADPSSQARRAERFIRQSEAPRFTDSNGRAVVLDKTHIRRFIHVAVTLDVLGTFTTALDQAADLGLFSEGPLPWAVSLLDLMAICDLVEFPAQLLHFLERRLRLNELKLVDATDELDWFGHYLLDGLYFEDPSQFGDVVPDRIFLQSHTTEIDDWYSFKEGTRRTPAERPHQKMPQLFRWIIESLEMARPINYSAAVCQLLDFSGDARERLSEAIEAVVALCARDGRPHNFSLVSGREASGVTCFAVSATDADRVLRRFQEHCTLKKYQCKASEWLGLCVVVHESGAIHLDSCWQCEYAWGPETELDEVLREMQATGALRDPVPISDAMPILADEHVRTEGRSRPR